MRSATPAAIVLAAAFCMLSTTAAPELRFDVDDYANPPDVPVIAPWKVVQLEPDYGGLWVVAGDVDGDGAAEIVSAENFNEGDVHYTSAVVVQELDGSVLWRWGDPDIGRKKWHHDVACQIHDWDGDDKAEVVLSTEGFVVELDGATGVEQRRLPIPDEATDCLVFCNLDGGPKPTDILVKNRYDQIWAYNRAGELLWTSKHPGGYRTAHQPRPMDIDGDGTDEIMAGYAMLNADGSVRWVYQSEKVDQGRGHLDCARLARRGNEPQDTRIVLTCCGANNLAMIDGNGKVCWEVSGRHFESITLGRLVPDKPGPHILVDIDHRPRGEGPLWVLDMDGDHLGRIMTVYARHHRLLDWTGDGVDEIVVGGSEAMYGNDGKRMAVFDMPDAPEEPDYETSVLVGEMSGDGRRDVLLVTPHTVYIYRNENGKTPEPPAPLGTDFNLTLY